MKEITARLWENKMYGTSYAKGQFRKAIYNGTMEVFEPYAKYLLDMEDIETWFNFTKNPIHTEMANRLGNPPVNEDGILMSWLYRYENGTKYPISGYAALDLNYKRITIQLDDRERGLDEHWELPVRTCIARIPGKPTPALIATTQTELSSIPKPPQKPSTNGVFAGGHKQVLENLRKYAAP